MGDNFLGETMPEGNLSSGFSCSKTERRGIMRKPQRHVKSTRLTLMTTRGRPSYDLPMSISSTICG